MKPWRLVDKARGGSTDLTAGRVRQEYVAMGAIDNSDPGGVVIDGVRWRLEGEPPRAVSKGWGDLSWTRR